MPGSKNFGYTIVSKKIFILISHPDAGETLSKTLAESYVRGACVSGHEVKMLHLGELKFDPILHKGYKIIQELEPDLVKVQEHFTWAEHVVIITPLWWGTMPALLKGLIDRIFLPGFAFRFHKDNPYRWDRLLKGRSARLLVLSDINPLLGILIFGNSFDELTKGVLRFSGIAPVRVTRIGSIKTIAPARVERLKQNMYALGIKAK